MSNYPAGAEYDSRAPWNESTREIDAKDIAYEVDLEYDVKECLMELIRGLRDDLNDTESHLVYTELKKRL